MAVFPSPVGELVGKGFSIPDAKLRGPQGFRPLSGSLWEKLLQQTPSNNILPRFRPLSGSLWEKL